MNDKNGCWGQAEYHQQSANKIVYVAAACLIDADGRLLLQQRPKNKHQGGKWEFPGGKIQPNELPVVACVRELQEELAINTSESCLAPLTFVEYDYEDFTLIMMVYVLRQWQGTINSDCPTKWVDFNQLVVCDMPPADKPIIPFLREIMI